MLGLLGVTVAEEVGNSKLGDADRVGEVDVYQSKSTPSRRVLAGRRARRTVEVAPVLSMLVSLRTLSGVVNNL